MGYPFLTILMKKEHIYSINLPTLLDSGVHNGTKSSKKEELKWSIKKYSPSKQTF